MSKWVTRGNVIMFKKANRAMYIYFICKDEVSEYIHENAKKIISNDKEIEFVFDDESAIRCCIEKDKIMSMSLVH